MMLAERDRVSTRGSLYVATPKGHHPLTTTIEAKLDSPPDAGSWSTTSSRATCPHGWKFIKIGPDGKLYVAGGRRPATSASPDPEK